MAESTNIAWCRSTFNPWIGCTKVSPGCEHCYASVSTPARSLKVQWGAGQVRRRTSAENWNKPLRWNKQAQSSGEFWPVFCSSLADVFDNEVPDQWRADLWDLIELTPYLTWLLLTKRIGNVMDMVPRAAWGARGYWPTNLWLGITVVNQEEADRDIVKLIALPPEKRFISYEPALGPIDFTKVLVPAGEGHHERINVLRLKGWDRPLIDWIIVGGESDQPSMKARPFNITWARQTLDQSRAASVPVFIKQLGSAPYWDRVDEFGRWPGHVEIVRSDQLGHHFKLRDRAGADPDEWTEDLRVQEVPR